MTNLKNKLLLLLSFGVLFSDSLLISTAYEQGYQSDVELKREAEANKKTVFRRRLLAACGITITVIFGAVFLVKRRKASVAPTTVAGFPLDLTIPGAKGSRVAELPSDDEAEEVDCTDGSKVAVPLAHPTFPTPSPVLVVTPVVVSHPAAPSKKPTLTAPGAQEKFDKWFPVEIQPSFMEAGTQGNSVACLAGTYSIKKLPLIIRFSSEKGPVIHNGKSFVDIPNRDYITVNGIDYFWSMTENKFVKSQ